MDLHISSVKSALVPRGIQVGCQNVSVYGAGAHTGEVSASAYKDMGLGWAICGHSERRQAGESSDVVAVKAKLAVDAGLQVSASNRNLI